MRKRPSHVGLSLTRAFLRVQCRHAFPHAGKLQRRQAWSDPASRRDFEEASFLKGLGEKQKPVSVKLMDGQMVSGWIEYYDKHMVRLTREGAPNLFIFKHEIMYIAEDGGKTEMKRPRAAVIGNSSRG